MGNNGAFSEERGGVWGEVQTAHEQKSVWRGYQVQNVWLEGTDNIHPSN